MDYLLMKISGQKDYRAAEKMFWLTKSKALQMLPDGKEKQCFPKDMETSAF